MKKNRIISLFVLIGLLMPIVTTLVFAIIFFDGILNDGLLVIEINRFGEMYWELALLIIALVWMVTAYFMILRNGIVFYEQVKYKKHNEAV